MHRFWPLVIEPLIRLAQPDVIVEVGAATGQHSVKLAEFTAATGATLHVVDPKPRFDPAELPGYPDTARMHREASLAALPRIGPVDVALLDGDHNWYTLFNELQVLERLALEADRPPPLVLCHDVIWPYARRDLYYDPASIPDEYRHEWRQAGILPGRDKLVPGRGLSPGLRHAAHEGGERNGVMTAIEDFMAGSSQKVALTVLPVLNGLGILAPASRLDAHPGLRESIASWQDADGLEKLCGLAERHRMRSVMALQSKR